MLLCIMRCIQKGLTSQIILTYWFEMYETSIDMLTLKLLIYNYTEDSCLLSIIKLVNNECLHKYPGTANKHFCSRKENTVKHILFSIKVFIELLDLYWTVSIILWITLLQSFNNTVDNAPAECPSWKVVSKITDI